MIVLPPNAALLLDLDGTLIDIAATPDAVVVPAGLSHTLLRVRTSLSDALAIVTGRPISQVDALLPGVPYAVAGEHGGSVRHAPGALEQQARSETIPQPWLAEAQALVDRHPGAILEHKARGFVLHFRGNPLAGPIFQTALCAMLAGWPHHAMGAAHMAWEVKPVGIDKGRATQAIMSRTPFLGRVPVFIGDDVTDEDGMQVARSMGGIGLRVQEHFSDAAGVRRWLNGFSNGV